MKPIKQTTKNKSTISAIYLITDYRLLITVMLPLCLTGCMGIYEGGFECPAGMGVGCKSISEVNAMVDHGVLPIISQEMRADFDRNAPKCESCGRSFSSNQEEPGIWINPLYLDSISLKPQSQNEGKAEDSAENLRKRIQEKIIREKDLHDKITL